MSELLFDHTPELCKLCQATKPSPSKPQHLGFSSLFRKKSSEVKEKLDSKIFPTYGKLSNMVKKAGTTIKEKAIEGSAALQGLQTKSNDEAVSPQKSNETDASEESFPEPIFSIDEGDDICKCFSQVYLTVVESRQRMMRTGIYLMCGKTIHRNTFP